MEFFDEYNDMLKIRTDEFINQRIADEVIRRRLKGIDTMIMDADELKAKLKNLATYGTTSADKIAVL